MGAEDDLSVVYNPFTWTNEVKIVFLEQPYGVGFSVVDEAKRPSGDDFLHKFPQYADVEINTAAESWGL